MTGDLKRNEYIWAVTMPDPNDSRYYPVAYFTDMGKAEEHARKCHGCVVQTTLYHEPSTGEFYKVETTRVAVDLPDRAEVLKKLTPKDREALGVK